MTQRSVFILSSFVGGLLIALSAATQAQTAAKTPDAMPKDKATVESAFKRADANKDGRLTKAEADVLPAVAARFDGLDKDKKGYLTFDEFAAAVSMPAN